MSPTSRVLELFVANENLFNIILILVSTTSVSWYIWVYVKSKTPGTSPSLPPGHPGLPMVGNLPFLDPELHRCFQSLAKRYGPILKLRFGSKLAIVVTSPALAKEIYKDQDINFSSRDVPLTASALTYGGIDMVCLPYGPEWRTIRKACVVNLLSRYTLDSFYHLRRQEVRKRARYLCGQAQEGLPVDIGHQMFLTMLNLIMNMLWGGSVNGDETPSLGIEFRQVIKEALRVMDELNISDFLP
ncbi:PREDICTED: flavonoid 3'-monooxygenase-like [Tarenaya hassleriana]|uniref:flavonoid 3'-monooxygenase-like n=1 Tax=Tarenaya hassleriana TaxID=28532 RepID=UPI00053C94D0|nr:PREDICTED: flavonoid 3'-monooxygenase-like [Tarenaya hassleriana]